MWSTLDNWSQQPNTLSSPCAILNTLWLCRPYKETITSSGAITIIIIIIIIMYKRAVQGEEQHKQKE